MIQKLLIIIFLLGLSNGFSQNNIGGTSYSHFQIKSKKDTIEMQMPLFVLD